MKDNIVYSINNFAYTKLAPSNVCNGVGVFALIYIPIDTILFQDIQPDLDYIPYSEINNKVIQIHLSSMCNSDANGVYLSRTYNNINMSYYINHSDDPNVYHDLENDCYVSIRDILPGEELTCIYTKQEKQWHT